MQKPEYVPLEILAYRLDGEDGWRIAETLRSVKTFMEDLLASGKPVIEVRPITSCSQRAGLKADDGRLSDIGYYMIIGRGWTWDDSVANWRAPEEMVNLLPTSPMVVENVNVTFHPADSGWQPVSISAGGSTVTFDASECYDPFQDILKWLESIVQGEQGRVSIDLEGRHMELFAFTLPDPARVRMVMALMPGLGDKVRDVELDIDIDRHQFVAVSISIQTGPRIGVQ